MNIGDIIAAITGGMDPNKAIMDAQGAMPGPPGPPPQQAAPPPPTAPQGAQTAFTNPQPNDRAPNITQSPPDLANMYVKLMKDNQNAQALDSGATLIAAGLSNNLATRQSLINSASAGGGRGAGGITSADIINLQKQQQAAQDTATRRSLLGGLAKQYKMTPAQIQYLEASGKLDEVLKHYATENLGQVKDENGQTHLIAPRTGQVITTIGSEKEDPTQAVAGPQGQQVINLRTGLPVAPGIGLTPDKVEVTLADGSKRIIDKNLIPSGGEVAPARKVGDEIPNMENERAIANAERKAKGLDPISVEDFKKLTVTPATNINVGTDGSAFPAPEKGYDYERTPEGKVKIGEGGRPKLYKIEGGKPADAAAVTAKEDAEKIKKEATQARLKQMSASTVVRSAEDAMKILDNPKSSVLPSAGFGASVGLAFGGTDAIDLKSRLGEITANTAFAQLKAMRDASTSGASGLGQVTDFEQRMLSNATSNIDQYQSIPALKKALRKAQATMLVLAENSFDDKDASAYNAALETKMAELEKKTGDVRGRHGNIRVKE